MLSDFLYLLSDGIKLLNNQRKSMNTPKQEIFFKQKIDIKIVFVIFFAIVTFIVLMNFIYKTSDEVEEAGLIVEQGVNAVPRNNSQEKDKEEGGFVNVIDTEESVNGEIKSIEDKGDHVKIVLATFWPDFEAKERNSDEIKSKEIEYVVTVKKELIKGKELKSGLQIHVFAPKGVKIFDVRSFEASKIELL